MRLCLRRNGRTLCCLEPHLRLYHNAYTTSLKYQTAEVYTVVNDILLVFTDASTVGDWEDRSPNFQVGDH